MKSAQLFPAVPGVARHAERLATRARQPTDRTAAEQRARARTPIERERAPRARTPPAQMADRRPLSHAEARFYERASDGTHLSTGSGDGEDDEE